MFSWSQLQLRHSRPSLSAAFPPTTLHSVSCLLPSVSLGGSEGSKDLLLGRWENSRRNRAQLLSTAAALSNQQGIFKSLWSEHIPPTPESELWGPSIIVLFSSSRLQPSWGSTDLGATPCLQIQRSSSPCFLRPVKTWPPSTLSSLP